MTFKNILTTLILIAVCAFVHAQTTPPPTSNPCIGPQGQLKWYYYNNVERGELNHLYTHHAYPQGPSGFEYVSNTSGVSRFNDYFGSLMKGYFTVPETGTYEFNVLGDTRVNFYMSTDDNPNNKELEVALTGVTGRTGFYTRPESISVPVNLVENTYYYFELHHKEQTGDDYAMLHWHTPSMPDSAWQIIPVNHVYEYTCDNYCQPAGTPCDDGDANTSNDREDGACNCIGDQPSALGCVGRQGVLQSLTWRDLQGNNLSDLYDDPRYPLMPDTVEFVELFNHLSTYNTMLGIDSFGQVIKTYLYAPYTGNYQFNMTADDRGVVYLSSDEEPFNRQLIANTVGGNGVFEHDEFPQQTSSVIPLVAGQYYYMEIHYKENTNTNRFYVYWKSDFYGDDQWRVVPTRYLFEYDCETACLPDGTACDDKNSSTYGDVISNCNCAGVPCPNGDCTELETYTPFDACAYKDEHSTSTGNSWLSCTTSPNPNPSRGDSHWILYDFSEVYSLNETTMYNYNIAGSTGNGVKDFVVDYSLNGVDWTTLGSYQLPQAPGISSYSGILGPDLNGLAARYILITALTSWNNGSCAGFSEIIFDASTCPDAGTTCDDGDSTTTDDRYDAYCNCAGMGLPINDCTVNHLVVADNPAQSKTYSAIMSVTSDLMVEQYANTNFIAGQEINLNAGFEVELGANFCADIIPCSGTSNLQTDDDESPSLTTDLDKEDFWVYNSPNDKLVFIQFEKEGLKSASMRIYDYKGMLVQERKYTKLNGKLEEKIEVNNFPKGVYTVSIISNSKRYTQRIVVE